MSIYHRDIQTLALRANANIELQHAVARIDARDVADGIVDMVAVQTALERAANAYTTGNLTECVEALCEAYDQELDHGAAPATDFLASQMLDAREEDNA